MTVEAISLGALPKVSAVRSAASRWAARAIAAAPHHAEIELPPVGKLELTYGGIADAEAQPPGQIAFGVWREGQAGRISVDAALAHALLGAALGALDLAPSRRLSAGERGLLGGLLAVALDRLDLADLGVTLSLAPPRRISAGAAIVVNVAAGARRGRAIVEVPSAWIALGARPERWAARAAGMVVPGRIVLGTTYLPGQALAAIEPGDAVIFDGVAASGGGSGPRPVQLAIGDYAAPATLAGAAGVSLTIEGPFFLARSPAGQIRTGEETDMAASSSVVDPASVLAAAPIEVTAEVGRITLRGEELLGLAPGVVLSFGGVRAPSVCLRVGGEIWAEGELVDVDGELGVRVTALRFAGRQDR
jgi:type III secretion system YscQ/HrcQ family protein